MEIQTVHLFVFDTLSDWEPAYAVAGINNPAFQARPQRYRVRTVGLTTDRVRTMGGVTVLPDMGLDDLEPSRSAMLILPGGMTWEEGGNTGAVEMARNFLATGVPVAAICGATAGLARAGLLDGLQHTSNTLEYLKATNYEGAANYLDQAAVTDGDLITAGGASPLEFAREIFRRLDVYETATLDAWYGLFKTGDPAYFHALVEASTGGGS
ncbi:MAG TPA: type 1 glutamine amidotransferase family protein [Syntrophobacter fumaroxidans]|nr:type 1 glutamine amidotransferase family protein [Syntrophobacter fumaroxidans]